MKPTDKENPMDLVTLGWDAGDSPIAPLAALCQPHHGPVIERLAEMAVSPRWCSQMVSGTGIKLPLKGKPKFTGHTSPAIRKQLTKMAATVSVDMLQATNLLGNVPYGRIAERAVALVLEHELHAAPSPLTFDQGSPLLLTPYQMDPEERRDPNIFEIGGLMPARLSVEDGHLAITLPGMRASGPFADEPSFNEIALTVLMDALEREINKHPSHRQKLFAWAVHIGKGQA